MSSAVGQGPLGRPRDATLDAVVLDATCELIGDVGLDRLRVQDVADRAGVGLATIYRRWPTKLDLVVAAIQTFSGAIIDSPALDDPWADLVGVFRMQIDRINEQGREFIPGIAAALRGDPEAAGALRSLFLLPIRERLRESLARLLDEDDIELRSRADMALAVLFYRSVILDEPTNTDWFMDLLLPLIVQPRPTPRPHDRTALQGIEVPAAQHGDDLSDGAV